MLNDKPFSSPTRSPFLPRARALLQQMTLAEKVGQMVQADLSWKQDIPALLRQGQVGSLLTIKDVSQINALQRIAVEESRLGIPLLIGNDVVHGYRTIFPIPLALSCTWDLALVEQIARVSRREAAASGTHWTFAPMVDICRDPRWGRIAEGAGEDPTLGAAFAAAWVRGFQAEPEEGGRPVAACVKHFAAYGGAEGGRDYNTVDMSERRLRQDYLPPYQAAVQAGVKTVMTSFNELNGIPATADPWLLQEILRGEWGFEGLIVSDFDAIGELVLHGYAKDLKQAALFGIRAGVDMDMMSNAYHFHLAELVREGLVAEARLDEAVLRVLALKLELGIFEQPYVDEAALPAELLRPGAKDLARRAAAEAAVLLQNEGELLPLQPAGKTVALIGPLAGERQSLLGSWFFDGRPAETETVLEGFQRVIDEQPYQPAARLLHAPGCGIEGDWADLEQALGVARQADFVVLALGESDGMSGEAHSRADLGLPGRQMELAQAVAALGKPTAALIFTGRPLVLTGLAEIIPALLVCWQGGTMAGAAAAELVLGLTSPSGRLTASVPRSVGQIPVYYAQKSTGRPVDYQGTLQFNASHKTGYLDESNDPLYPFGFGLTYTKFSYAKIEVETPTISPSGALIVSAQVSNRGTRPGVETVQCYTRDLFGALTRPVKELRAFQKIRLKPGETRQVRFEIPAGQLAFIGPDHRPLLEPGDFKVWIGPNSAEGLEGAFCLLEA